MYPYIEIFGHTLQSYYLCAAAAGIVGTVLSAIYLLRSKQGIWAVILPVSVCVSALIGARVLNFVTNPRAFSGDFSVWTLSYRKLSLMGGLIAGVAILAIVFSGARWIILPLRELPYDRQIVTVFYPCLYAAVICFAGIFLVKHAVAGKQK